MKKRALNDKQVLTIINNPNLSNIDLAKRLKVRPALIGTYKSRLRKLGVELPKNVPSIESEDTLSSLARVVEKHNIATKDDDKLEPVQEAKDIVANEGEEVKAVDEGVVEEVPQEQYVPADE